MPGTRVSPAQRNAFFALISGGVAASVAADRVGLSRSTGYRLMKGNESGPSRTVAAWERDEEQQPAPKRWEELDGGVQDMLRFDGGFSLFCATILLRRPVPWREDAARRVVAAIQDRTERSYMIANAPPGSGKSTLWGMDIPLWLLCGGGFEDPIRGRAIRMMLGSFAKTTSVHYVRRIKQLLESPRPYVDLETQRTAELGIVEAFGRFRPRQPGVPWRSDEVICEQMEDIDLSEKEATISAVSRESGFLGERCVYASFDDLVVPSNVRSVDIRETLAEWFSNQAETRIEPGGLLALVGQRLGPNDLYRDRMNIAYQDDDGIEHKKYSVVKYPAHNEETCPGESHTQWNALPADQDGEGCLLDEVRLPWKELRIGMQQNPRNFKMLYQQLDVDAAGALVDLAWLEGGTDSDGVVAPGCFDRDRGFDEWPTGVGPLVDYVVVDPSAGRYWGIEWWAVQKNADPASGARYRYLIRGLRTSRFQAGDLLDWDIERAELSGLMETWMAESKALGHPISVWVIETNSAFVQLSQHEAWKKWQQKWGAKFLPFVTGVNKNDVRMGVEGLLPGLYRSGQKRLPRAHGDLEAINYMRAKIRELTEYPESSSSDLVMCDWIGEWSMPQILRAAERDGEPIEIEGLQLPPYLARQRTGATCEAYDCGRAIVDDEQSLCGIHSEQYHRQWGGRHISPRPTMALEGATA